MAKSQDEYITDSYKKLADYIKGVEGGLVVCNRYIKKAVQRFQEDKKRSDIEFRKDKLERVLKFFSVLRINYRNTYIQFPLLPFQVFILANLFGWYYSETNKRRYRYFFLWIARKNGKTSFAAALNLYFLIMDGVKDPQSLLLANSREQSTNALNYAKSIVTNSPALAKRVEVLQYSIRFKNKGSVGTLKTLASQAQRLDGYSPSSVILDEIHGYQDDSLFRVMKSGIISRENPLLLMISTAGFKKDSFCMSMVLNSKNILDSVATDDSFFTMLFTLDDEDDFRDQKNWVKSNPALGSIIQLEDLEIEYNQTKNLPSQLPNFLTKNLNIFTEETTTWIPDQELQTCFVKVNEEDLLGQDCYVGVDLSSTRDLTSIVCLFQTEEGFSVLPYFYFANNPRKRIRKNGVDLTTWINQGYINECRTQTIDYNQLLMKISELAEKFNVISIGYDKFNSALLIPQVENDLGLTCHAFPQTAPHFNFPLKYLEKLIYDQKIKLSDNKVLLWNFRNSVLYEDSNGNIKVMKNRSLDSVDGVVSLAQAMGMYLKANDDKEAVALQQALDYYKEP